MLVDAFLSKKVERIDFVLEFRNNGSTLTVTKRFVGMIILSKKKALFHHFWKPNNPVGRPSFRQVPGANGGLLHPSVDGQVETGKLRRAS